jgi:hypothetical protein
MGVWLDVWHPEIISSPETRISDQPQDECQVPALRADINRLESNLNRAFMNLLRIFLCVSSQPSKRTFHQIKDVELHLCGFNIANPGWENIPKFGESGG